MAQKVLNRPYVVVCLQEVSGKGMAEGMDAHCFVQPCQASGISIITPIIGPVENCIKPLGFVSREYFKTSFSVVR